MTETLAQQIQHKTDQELVDICNLPRNNSEMIEYVRAAYTELTVRGKSLEIIDRDSEGVAIYALKGE